MLTIERNIGSLVNLKGLGFFVVGAGIDNQSECAFCAVTTDCTGGSISVRCVLSIVLEGVSDGGSHCIFFAFGVGLGIRSDIESLQNQGVAVHSVIADIVIRIVFIRYALYFNGLKTVLVCYILYGIRCISEPADKLFVNHAFEFRRWVANHVVLIFGNSIHRRWRACRHACIGVIIAGVCVVGCVVLEMGRGLQISIVVSSVLNGYMRNFSTSLVVDRRINLNSFELFQQGKGIVERFYFL